MRVKLTVDVYSHHDVGLYRVYVDNDLLTERNWAWDHKQTFIRENIEVDVNPGKHVVKIEGHGSIYAKNLSYETNNDLSFELKS